MRKGRRQVLAAGLLDLVCRRKFQLGAHIA